MNNLEIDNEIDFENPLIDSPVSENQIAEEFRDLNTESEFETPFADPEEESRETSHENQYENEQLLQNGETVYYPASEFQVHQANSTIKVGDVTFAVADGSTASSEEYKEPFISGNPLLIIPSKDRPLHISKNFTVDELTRSEKGKHKFNFARIDPLLVDNIQRLRNFLGKPVIVIDGYYSPKYLREVLKIKDAGLIKLNPHITGRGLKIYVAGYKGMVKQIAIAALAACDRGINTGIGTETMTLYVNQPLASDINVIPEDFQRIVSYISDEKTKVEVSKFCVDVKRILYNHAAAYEKEMYKSVAALAVVIFKFYYRQDFPAEWQNWEIPVRNIISLMYDKSITKSAEAILYCLAYSPFGNLYRHWFNDSSERGVDTVNALINMLTTDTDRKFSATPGGFISSMQKPDKTNFVDSCRQRIILAKGIGSGTYHFVPANFFDWKYHKSDKTFLNSLSGIIKDVFFKNQYQFDIPLQQSPEGGTSRDLTLSSPDPDKPVKDFTGRYWAEFPADDKTLYGRYVLINQAGNYVAGKFGGIYKLPVKNLRGTISEFYGKIDDKGNVICNLFPQQTLILKKDQSRTRFYIVDNASDKIILNVPVILRSPNPVISNSIINSFSQISRKHEDLLLTLAWVQPLPVQLKLFFDSFKKSESLITEAITKYYKEDETVPSVRKNKLSSYVTSINSANDNYLKLPPMFIQFASYYAKFFYSVSDHWSPGKDRETRSTLDWIKKTLEDYRDLTGSADVVQRFEPVYKFFDVDTKIPDVLYHYRIKMKLKAYGFGPFARSSGTITIENKTNYAKYPKAQKWGTGNSTDYPITLWNATVSLNPGKWLPKISSGQSIEAEIQTNAFYSATDFSGAGVQVTEGKVFEIPVSKSSGGVKGSTKAGIGGVVILIDGHGKKTLELTSELKLGLPDTLDIEPSDTSSDEGTFEKIAGFLPSLTMYKGSIGTKDVLTDIVNVPLPDSFSASYQLKNTGYFKHDNAVLFPQAIEAVGRMCAEELSAFSDPDSTVEIYGHTDASGKPEYNLKLSEMRGMNTKQAIQDRLGKKLKAKIIKVKGLGEKEANDKFGQFTQKNAWLRRVIIIINGRAVLSLGEI